MTNSTLLRPRLPAHRQGLNYAKHALDKASHIPITVEELVGDYSSPTILVEGYDVTGRLQQQKDRPACRLELPTEEQASDSLMSFARFGAPAMSRGRASLFEALGKPVRR